MEKQLTGLVVGWNRIRGFDIQAYPRLENDCRHVTHMAARALSVKAHLVTMREFLRFVQILL